MALLKSTLFTSVLMSVSAIFNNHAHLTVNSPLEMGSPLQIFDLIRDKCGDVCNTTIGPKGPGKYYDVVKKTFDCDRLFSDDFIEGWEQPKDIAPPDFESLKSIGGEAYYSYLGRINITNNYMNTKPSTQKIKKKVWSEKMFQEYRAMFRKKKLKGSYRISKVLEVENLMRNNMMEHIIGGRALVIGSESPWLEVMLLELGAASVTTLEYNDIETSVENVKVIKPLDAKRMWKERAGNFDVIVTYSSLEHSGMGRYGDPLNPWGDLIASARAW